MALIGRKKKGRRKESKAELAAKAKAKAKEEAKASSASASKGILAPTKKKDAPTMKDISVEDPHGKMPAGRKSTESEKPSAKPVRQTRKKNLLWQIHLSITSPVGNHLRCHNGNDVCSWIKDNNLGIGGAS